MSILFHGEEGDLLKTSIEGSEVEDGGEISRHR